ncbi:MAG: EAL domain-containing protein [Gammaproteobacteria bacterium]|nr:EAL domain-containing protein [Gammaproteobacteria bacterium]
MEMQGFSQLILLTMAIAMAYLIFASYKVKNNQDSKIKRAIKKSEENFKFALWGSGDEIWEWTLKTDQLVRSNPIKLLDVQELNSDLHMKEIVPLIHPDDLPHTQSSLVKLVKCEDPHYEETFRIYTKHHGYLWVLARARVVERDFQNHTVRVLGSLKDITLIKATEDKLALIAKAFDNTKDGISILAPDFKAVLNNQAFYAITGQEYADSVYKQYFFSEQSLNHEQYHQVKVALNNFGGWEGEIWEKKANGEKFAIDLKIDTVRNMNREISHYICVFSDITYRKKSDEELRQLANFDSLTKLPNRSLFMDRLSQALAISKRNKTQFALLFIDLDNFKTINDSLGHSFGDLLLQKVANRLRRCIRNSDTIARLGGDEFTIILENIMSADEVCICANKIIKRMMKSIEISGTVIITTPSIGIGIYPDDGEDTDTLLKNADLAMYSAKEKGRNNYQFFNPTMTGSAIERINIENKLRDAIDKEQLELYYQPKVCTENGKLTGFEALVRWIHPEEGIISPADFIPVAEETGLILPMGDWILEEAIKQAKLWSEINSDACIIAINLSARQFQQEGLSNLIKRLLDKHELSSKYIELEITEGTLMYNMAHTVSTLNKLRSMGISLALDDFGTGYSSLSYLKKFPVNKLKVDQSFVRDITTDPGDASIVASIISLAHNLEMTVVAEGCESSGQLDFIRAYDCEEVQGYLFSRPLAKDDAEVILLQGKIDIP